MSNRIAAAVARKALIRSLQDLRKLLVKLGQRHVAHRFYWRNGVVRERWLRPTKGWMDMRHSRFPLGTLIGQLDIVAINDAIARLKRA